MGDALVSGLVRDVVQKLASVAFKEFRLVWGFKDDVSTLKDCFRHIQAVLQDAEEKSSKKKTVKLWLNRLRSESLKMENVFDEVSTEAMLRKLHKELGIKYRVKAFFSSSHNQLMFRIRIAHKVKDIRKKIADIDAQKDKFNLTPVTTSVHVDAGVAGEMPTRETFSLINSSNIFGRDEEMERVVEKICNKDIGKHDDDNIRVYAIWGMGGLGKTTLAQLVYNHERVKNHFELKCWRYVSEKYQVKEVIRGIIESIDKSECRLSQLDDLQLTLQEKLNGMRFLVVLDDVWIEESEKSEWEKLRITLSCGAEGSIVLVTTRKQTTSRMMAQVRELQHELGCLSEEDSWSLFEKLAFAEGRAEGDRRELEPIGKEIVEKCKGLPLAVKTLGGMMWSKSSKSDWERVKGSDIWELQENDILPALKLSYDNLLPHLKRCFSYCCLFPKGYEMKKDLLILLWMANGFIPPRGDGEEIYNCLAWRSFFQVVDEEYKMHDLMHDLAQYVMRHDCSVIEPGKELITPEEVLHLSSSCPDVDFSNKELKSLRSLRSIFIFEADDDFDFKAHGYNGSIDHILDFGYLRVLYLVGLESKTLPESICKLKYLKYLNLSKSEIEVVPESIIYLQNLQTLLLEECDELRKLPEGMSYMRNLQHLNIKYCTSLMYLPVGIKGLTGLRILPYFPIDENNGARIGELGDLNLLEGELEIKGLENVEGGLREAKNANLKCKTNLFVLKFQWEKYVIKPERIAGDEEVLEGLEPNPSLKELEILGCMGNNISPSWILNLNNLVRIQFFYCTNCENIPPLGKLPCLTVIKLYHMYSLKCFHDEDYTTNSGDNTTLFPSLQHLHIFNCGRLVSLPSYFPKLEELYLHLCDSLLSLPDEIQSFKDLNELKISSSMMKCEQISPLGKLPSLKLIKLERMDSLKCFHDEDYTTNSGDNTTLFPSLQELVIGDCPNLVSLPSYFPKLKELYIKSCESLVSLPDEIQSFKDLNQLTIISCRNLNRRYEIESGVDWPKISHIPNISISGNNEDEDEEERWLVSELEHWF